MDIKLRRRTAEPLQALNIALYGIAPAGATASIIAEIYWRFESDPTMPPQYLGAQRAGSTLSASFNVAEPIRLFMVSKTADGLTSVSNVSDGEQLLLSPGSTPVGSAPSALFIDNIGTSIPGQIDVRLNWTNNGGTGSNVVEQKFGSGVWNVVDTVAAATATSTVTVFAAGFVYWRVRNTSADGYSNVVSNYWNGT